MCKEFKRPVGTLGSIKTHKVCWFEWKCLWYVWNRLALLPIDQMTAFTCTLTDWNAPVMLCISDRGLMAKWGMASQASLHFWPLSVCSCSGMDAVKRRHRQSDLKGESRSDGGEESSATATYPSARRQTVPWHHSGAGTRGRNGSDRRDKTDW